MDKSSTIKNIVYISIGLILSIGIGLYLNNNQVEWDIGIVISWALAITVLIIMVGITVCSFLLAKPLSKKIEL